MSRRMSRVVDTVATVYLTGHDKADKSRLFYRLAGEHGLEVGQSTPFTVHWYGPRVAVSAACEEWAEALGLKPAQPLVPNSRKYEEMG